MNYPLISEYIEAIKSAEDNFEELSYLRPVLGADGLPVMTGGNFAEVFKMKDVKTGKFYAVKCFTKEQEGRAEAYREIAKELKDVSSPYLVSIRYLEKELFVDTEQTDETEFPVLLMDWVEGKTLDKYLRENLDDKYALEMLAYRFSQLAQWLIPQPFAHGDLKPDNILVREDGTLVLVDYDGMYVPAMKGQKARELGSPDFRHPQRTEDDFNEHIDDFPLVSILLSLVAISDNAKLLEEYGSPERLLFSEKDYSNLSNNKVIPVLLKENNAHIISLITILHSLCHFNFTFTIPVLEKPYQKYEVLGYPLYGLNLLHKKTNKKSIILSINNIIEGLIELDDLMKANGIDYVLTGSLGLYFHGITPISYVPHDIDIIFSDNNNKLPNMTSQMILDLFVYYCGGERADYTCYNVSDLFVFYIGSNKIEINAFVDRKKVFDSTDYCTMNIMGRDIKVNKALSIIKEKYKLRRLKDYEFNNDIQNVLNECIYKQTDIIANDNKEMPEEEMKEWICFFFKNINIEFSTSIKVFSILFDSNVKPMWLNKQQCCNCLLKTTLWDEYKIMSGESAPLEKDAIEYSINGSFSRKCKPDQSIFIFGRFGEVSYIADFLYGILREMGLIDNFLTNIYKLVAIFNNQEKANGIALKLSLNDSFLSSSNIPTAPPNDIKDIWTDDYGAIYSHDGKFLIKGVNIPNYEIRPGTQVIMDDAFNGCSSLVSINIPDSVTHIGDTVFYHCKTLQEIIIPKSVYYIGKNPFIGCTQLCRVYCKSHKFIYVNGLLMSSDYQLLISCINCWGELEIPYYIDKIGDCAFSSLEQLRAVYMPKTVRTIGESAFSGCTQLEKVVFSVSLVSIEAFAFAKCKSLKGIELPQSLNNIGERAFSWCENLSVVYLQGKEKIADNAFFHCRRLSRIIVPFSDIDKYKTMLPKLSNVIDSIII